MSELKPCPFCGGIAELYRGRAKCASNCEYEYGMFSIAEWNERPIERSVKCKFKIGDKVKLNKPSNSMHGVHGTITVINRTDGRVHVNFSPNAAGTYDIANLELVESEEQPAQNKPVIPGWCSQGSRVYWKGAPEIGWQPGYMKVVSVSDEGIVTCDKIQGVPFDQEQLVQARLRPWNKEELKNIVGSVIDFGAKRCLCLRVHDGWADFLDDCDYEDDVAHIVSYNARGLQHEAKMSDGSPCGVLEHKENGKWVK